MYIEGEARAHRRRPDKPDGPRTRARQEPQRDLTASATNVTVLSLLDRLPNSRRRDWADRQTSTKAEA
jgi:hypothetical protein